MAATYPTGIRAFPIYANGDQVTPATINDPNLEITAIETGLRDGLAHHVVPDLTGNQRSLGTSGAQWYDLVLSHNATIGGTLTVTGGITGTSVLETLAVTGNAVLGGSLFVNGPSLLDALGVRASRPAGQAALTVENVDAAGVGALFRAGAGTGLVVQVQNVAQDPVVDIHADGSINTAGNVVIGGTLTVQGDQIITGTTTFTNITATGTLNVTGLTTLSGVTVTGGITAGGAVIQGVIDVRTSVQSYGQTGVTYSSTPVTIFTTTRPHSPADVGGLVLVCGSRLSDPAIQFIDLLLVMTDGTRTVVSSHNKGAANPRTYTWSGLSLQISTVSDTYIAHTLPIMVGSSTI